MGYHANEETTKKAVADACRFINDRARLEFALQTTLATLGVCEQQRSKVVTDIKAADFRSLHKLLRQPIPSSEGMQ